MRAPLALTQSLSDAARAIEVLERDLASAGPKRRQLFLVGRLRERLGIVEFVLQDETSTTREPWGLP